MLTPTPTSERPTKRARLASPPPTVLWSLAENSSVAPQKSFDNPPTVVNPRQWASSKEELLAIFPELENSPMGISWRIEIPTILLENTKSTGPGMTVALVQHSLLEISLARQYLETTTDNPPAEDNPERALSSVIPRPIPPEIQALVDFYLHDTPVLCIASKECMSDLWNVALPPEKLFAYLGFHSVVSVTETCSTSLQNSGVVQWRFLLKWGAGGEEQLGLPSTLDLDSPWWQPSQCENPVDPDEISSTEIYAVQRRTDPNYEYMKLPMKSRCSSVLPLHVLLDQHDDGADPGFYTEEERRGWFCTACGKLNRVMSMRHRRCRSLSCANASQGPCPGFSIPLDRIRTPHEVLPLRIPEYSLPADLTDPHIQDFWPDGMRVLRWFWHGRASMVDIFAGNCEALQKDASDLLGSIQVGCELVRESIHSPYFEHDATGPAQTWADCLIQARDLISHRLSMYANIRGTIRRLFVRGWLDAASFRKSDSHDVDTPTRYAAIMCLGKSVELKISRSSHRGKSSSFSLTLVHGDVLVLSEDQFEVSMTRAGTSILVTAYGEKDM